MADLARSPAVAVEQLPVQDDARADAVADVDDHQALVRPVAVAERVLADRRRLAVVQHRRRQPVAIAQELAEREVPPVEVDRVHDDAAARVDEAGRSDSDADERPRRRRDEPVEHFVDRAERGVAVARGDRQVDRVANLAAQVDERSVEAVLREVEADQVARVGDDAHQDRRLASARRAHADFLHEALFHQPRDDLGHRRPREPRDPRDLRATHRGLAEDSAQHQVSVVALGVLLRRLLHGLGSQLSGTLFNVLFV